MEAGAELIARTQLICGATHVITDPAVLSVYRGGNRRSDPLPLAAVLPGSATEVAGVVRACAELKVQFRVRGAGTAPADGPHADSRTVLLVTTRMRRILSVSTDDAEITVEPGVPLETLAQQAPPGWTVPGTHPPGTAAGWLAQGGDPSLVRAVDLIQPDGVLTRFDRRQPGYDLTGAFAGSHGRGGVAVALTLQLVATA